jgi:hypothetical protein
MAVRCEVIFARVNRNTAATADHVGILAAYVVVIGGSLANRSPAGQDVTPGRFGFKTP